MLEGDSPVTEEHIQIQSGNGGSMTVTEVTGLVQLFNNQLLAMEGRLVLKIDEAASAQADRWTSHDVWVNENSRKVDARFEKIEAAMLITEKALEAHLDREHDEQIAIDARVKPVKTAVGFLWEHWRDLVLLGIGLFAFLTFMAQFIDRII